MVFVKSHKKKQVFSSIVVFMLLFYPVIQTYGYGHYNFAFIITTILSILALSRTGVKSYMPKLLNYYFLFWGLSHILMASSVSAIVPVGVIRTYLLFNMFFKEFDYEKCMKFYSNAAVIFLAFFFFQEFIYATTGYRVLGVIQSLPLALDIDAAAYYEKMAIVDRSASFFSEPAHFVQFLLPLLAIKIFQPTKKFDYVFAIIIIVALLLMQSGNALLGLVAIGVSFVVEKIFQNFNIKKFFLLLFLALTVGIATYYYLGSEMGQNILARQDQLDSKGDAQTGQSGFKRIFRGYYVYDAMTPIEKVIGADDTGRINTAIASSIVAWSFNENDYYFNVVQTLLIRTGIIGTIIFFFFMIGSFKKVNSCGKSILTILLFLCFISAIHFTPVMALYILLALSCSKDNKDKKVLASNKV